MCWGRRLPSSEKLAELEKSEKISGVFLRALRGLLSEEQFSQARIFIDIHNIVLFNKSLLFIDIKIFNKFSLLLRGLFIRNFGTSERSFEQ